MHAADGDVTAEVRAQWPGGADVFDSFAAEAQLMLQRCILDGPADARELAELRAYGFDPRAGLDVTARRLQQELDQVAVFDANPQWRSGRLRDVVAAREILIEINEALYESLADRGASLDDVAPSAEAARDLFDGMPSFDVAVTLKTAYHRDAQHRWSVNDIHDIDALGSAVPYADIVVTDKAVAHQLNARGVATRCGTTVIARLEDLPALL
jgi:hypothetical protein